MPAALLRLKSTGYAAAAAFVWGMAMTMTAAAGLLLRNRLETFHLPTILLVFFAGGLAAWLLTELIGRYLRRFIGHGWLRLCLAAIGLGAATVFLTAAFFALEYRSFYAQWHAPTFSRIWFLQFIFTSASAYYQFAVMALRLYLPLGPFLLLPGTWFMHRCAK